mmetsp:Transcript_25971/g.78980  ORF Transcript_25971/g.78980 Transcript_25971/m.78980 type:complete len:112 (-) Transcript_25971:66-401(-)|eukprot:scaffold138381_cov36-Tisochrysis_lutea.AAC.4
MVAPGGISNGSYTPPATIGSSRCLISSEKCAQAVAVAASTLVLSRERCFRAAATHLDGSRGVLVVMCDQHDAYATATRVPRGKHDDIAHCNSSNNTWALVDEVVCWVLCGA